MLRPAVLAAGAFARFFGLVKILVEFPPSVALSHHRQKQFQLWSLSTVKMPLPSFQTNQEVLWLRGFRREPLLPFDRKFVSQSKSRPALTANIIEVLLCKLASSSKTPTGGFWKGLLQFFYASSAGVTVLLRL